MNNKKKKRRGKPKGKRNAAGKQARERRDGNVTLRCFRGTSGEFFRSRPLLLAHRDDRPLVETIAVCLNPGEY